MIGRLHYVIRGMKPTQIHYHFLLCVDYDVLLADDELLYDLGAHGLIFEDCFATELSDGAFLADHQVVHEHSHFGVVIKLEYIYDKQPIVLQLKLVNACLII